MRYTAKYIATLACASILSIFSALGDQISESQARAIAARSFKTLVKPHTRGANDGQLRLAYRQNTPSGQADFYVFTPASSSGFVVIAGDDCLPEVLGYSDNNQFAKDSIPPQLQEIFNFYGEYIKKYSGKLRSSASPKTRGSGAVLPLLGDIAWDQNAPFNLHAPYVGRKKAPTGCVATAVAQIMRYHSWPPAGKGKGEFYKGENTKSGFSVMIEGRTYSWCAMRNSYPDLDNNDANEAVAQLMRDVGAAVGMRYGENESSALSSGAAIGLFTNFQYSSSLRLMRRQAHSSEEWESAILNELYAKRPVFYGGGSPNGGHAFVCDGYDGQGLFHINWGWSGNANGFYALAELLPGYQGTGAGGGGGYTSGQDIVVGIQPETPNAQPEPLIYAEEFEVTKDRWSNGIVANISAFNHSGEPLTGKFGVLLYNSINEEVKQISDREESSGIPITMGVKGCIISLSDVGSLSAGTYRVIPAFYMTDKAQWVPIRIPLNMPQFYTLTLDGSGSITIGEDDRYKVKLDATVNKTNLYVGQNIVSVTYTNNGVFPYSGLIGFRFVYNSNDNVFSRGKDGIYYTNSFIEPGKSVTFETTVASTTPHDNRINAAQYLQLLYDKTNDLYDPRDYNRDIPHDVLKSVAITLEEKKLGNPLCKIESDIPAECDQWQELTVDVSVKLDDPNSYYSGPIALQFILNEGSKAWIKGSLDSPQNLTLEGDATQKITFKGPVNVAEGDYKLSVGIQRSNGYSTQLGWDLATPLTANTLSEVERAIHVKNKPFTETLPTFPVVMDVDKMNTTAVVSAKVNPLRVSPNPATEELHIESNDGQPIESAALYSLTGQCVKRIEMEKSSHLLSIDVSQLPEGLYILRVEGAEKGRHGASKVIVVHTQD